MNNFNKDKILKEIEKNSGGKIDMNALGKAAERKDVSGLVSSLPDEDKQKILDVINDKKALQSLLKNPKVAGMLDGLLGGGK